MVTTFVLLSKAGFLPADGTILEYALVGMDDYLLYTEEGVYVFKPFFSRIIFYHKDTTKDNFCSDNNVETIALLKTFIREKKYNILLNDK